MIDTGVIGYSLENPLHGAGSHINGVIDSKVAINQRAYAVGEGYGYRGDVAITSIPDHVCLSRVHDTPLIFLVIIIEGTVLLALVLISVLSRVVQCEDVFLLLFPIFLQTFPRYFAPLLGLGIHVVEEC